MPIKLIAKGPAKSVKRAAQRRGISVTCRMSDERFSQAHCQAKCGQGDKIRKWFGDAVDIAKGGRGYPPGTLLYFKESCGTLDGPRRRKSRRAL